MTQADWAVTAVVVTWDSAQHVTGCLEALLAQDHPVEVVVVDNGSTDDTVDRVEAVATRAPGQVRLLREGTNTGFCAAVNRGIAASDGEAVLLVNPDARLAVDHVRHLVAALRADDGLGSVQGTLWRPQRAGRPRRVDSTGHRAFVTRLWANRDEGRTAPSPGGEVFGVTGAAALHRRAMLDDVAVPRDLLAGRTAPTPRAQRAGDHVGRAHAGERRTARPTSRAQRAGDHGGRAHAGERRTARPTSRAQRAGDVEVLDETLFAYWDDVDLDWRARLRGWRAAHVDAATGVHERGGARARRTALVEECNAANRLLVVAKLDDRRSLLRALPAVTIGTLLKLSWLALTHPRVLPGVVRRIVRGWGPTRRRRRWALATATVAPADVVAEFESFDWRGWVRRWWRRTRHPLDG